MSVREEREELLNDHIEKWNRRLCRALINVENNRRRAAGMKNMFPVTTHVFMPAGLPAGLSLLNFKVWCLRYCVTPEFILEHILQRFRTVRQIARGMNIPGTAIQFGLPAKVITGPIAHQYIEDMVNKLYPNDENRKSIMTPVPVITDPPDPKDFQSIDKFVQAYQESVTKARRRFSTTLQKKSSSVMPRRLSAFEPEDLMKL